MNDRMTMSDLIKMVAAFIVAIAFVAFGIHEAWPSITKWTNETIEEIKKPAPPKTYILQRAGRDTYIVTERP
jgi:hypothetical protein